MTRILVVDDESQIRGLVAELLTDEGHTVQTAANGVEALATIRRWRPDAVLLDLMMPIADGWAFLDAYAADPLCRGVPIGVLSAAPTAGLALEERGVWAVIPKPFEAQALLLTVEELVRHSALRRGVLAADAAREPVAAG
jgi:CheY-like chemotaxis protein